MRPIDADAIKLPKGFFEEVDNVPKFYEWLNEQPTIDAVPVVRCKDCRWYDREREDSPIGYCHACKHAYFSSSWEIGIYRTHKPDFFCADGERSEFPDAESKIDEWWERSETVNAERSEE